jgi:hypothetical protein
MNNMNKNNEMTWRKDGYGVWTSADGIYTIRKTANPTAARVWYIQGGSREFLLALCKFGGTADGGFFKLRNAKMAVAIAASR